MQSIVSQKYPISSASGRAYPLCVLFQVVTSRNAVVLELLHAIFSPAQFRAMQAAVQRHCQPPQPTTRSSAIKGGREGVYGTIWEQDSV